jgi:hypothetical protein
MLDGVGKLSRVSGMDIQPMEFSWKIDPHNEKAIFAEEFKGNVVNGKPSGSGSIISRNYSITREGEFDGFQLVSINKLIVQSNGIFSSFLNLNPVEEAPLILVELGSRLKKLG